jgi:hypothetical protein
MRNAPLLGLLATLALAGCDKPKDRTPPPPKPATASQAASAPTTLPALPAWSGEVLGKPAKALFPGEFKPCVGNTDSLEQKYTDGVRIIGWGWDLAAKTPIARVLLTDAAGVVVGVGETGVPRPDVNAAKPEIPSPTTGWAGLTRNRKGPVIAYGIIDDGKSLCQLGRLEF